MKISKRLIKAVIALVASLVLCIGICFAWYAQNEKLKANGANFGIRSINIKSFTVTAISLKDKTTSKTGVTTYTVDKVVSGTSAMMAPYGNLDGDETALLLEFKYTFNEALGNNYGIFAHLQMLIGDGKVEEEKQYTDYDFKCDLSSATCFYGATVDGTKVTLNDEITETGENLVSLNGGAATDNVADTELTFYCIIDYDVTDIDQLYLKAGDMGGDIWSQMRFVNDIDFYMAEV